MLPLKINYSVEVKILRLLDVMIRKSLLIVRLSHCMLLAVAAVIYMSVVVKEWLSLINVRKYRLPLLPIY